MENIENKIIFEGINTNNLKDIDVNILKNKITCIYGKSGSGKSSLAFNTIYAISHYEQAKLENKESFEDFRIKNYKNIISAIAIKQLNKNNNPLSTIYSFTVISKLLKTTFSYLSEYNTSKFSLNNPTNLCKECLGSGYSIRPNMKYIIDETCPLESVPIKYYNQSKQEVFNQIFLGFCEVMNIDTKKTFSELNQQERELILYDNSDIKIDISYSMKTRLKKKRYIKKKMSFIGIFKELEDLLTSGIKIKDVFFRFDTCGTCKGSLFNHDIGNIEILGKKIEDIMLLEIFDLYSFFLGAYNNIIKKSKQKIENQILKSMESLLVFLRTMVNNNLGYLKLTRNIPSLSGGEFQKLHFCSILNSKLTDYLYVIDELSSNLHISEYQNIFNQIYNIKENNNTIILVEHEDFFINRSDILIKIGPDAGINGGKIIDYGFNKQELISKTVTNNQFRKKRQVYNFLEIKNINKNNLKNFSLLLPKDVLVCLCGISGSGKSSLANYLSDNNKNFIYINQRIINSTNTSVVASFLDILTDIRDIYAKENNKPKSLFSFNTEDGQCNYCKGKGIIEEKISFSKAILNYLCPICEGKRFADKVMNYKYKGYDIYQILNLTVEELIKLQIFIDKKALSEKLYLFREVGLEYLNLFRSTKEISGGESQRLKIIQYINSNIKGKYFIFDEPFRGIDRENFKKIFNLFDKLIDKQASVLIIEHKMEGIINSDYVIELDGAGDTGGNIIFEGTLEGLQDSEKSIIKNYIKK